MGKVIHMKLKRKQAGFTLVELMVSTVIFGVMMGMVMLIITSANTSFQSANARIVSQQDLRRALTSLFHELSESNQYRVDIPVGNPSQITFQIPIAVGGEAVDERNNILFGSRPIPTTDPEGTEDYAVQYVLIPNNDLSNSSTLVRRVLDAYPAGNQVGADRPIATNIDTLSFIQNAKTLSIAIAAVKHNKYGRNIRISGNFGVTLRN